MPPAPLVAASLLGSAAAGVIVRLALEPEPFGPESAAAISLGTGLLAIVTVAGLLLARSIWARASSVVLASSCFAIVLAGDLDLGAAFISALALAAVAAAAGPWLQRWIRRLPAADGPPPAAVGLLLGLTATPLVVGLTTAGEGPGAAGWGLAAWALALAFVIARARSWALWPARVAHPLVGIAAAVSIGPVPGTILAAKTVAESVLAWRRDVSSAIRPLLPDAAAAVPIPPELVDPAIMEAAGLDDRGTPLERD
jgi:hypothetical protein